MQSNNVEPYEVFLVFNLSKISRVKYFFNSEPLLEFSNFVKPDSIFSNVFESTVSILFLNHAVAIESNMKFKKLSRVKSFFFVGSIDYAADNKLGNNKSLIRKISLFLQETRLFSMRSVFPKPMHLRRLYLVTGRNFVSPS